MNTEIKTLLNKLIEDTNSEISSYEMSINDFIDKYLCTVIAIMDDIEGDINYNTNAQGFAEIYSKKTKWILDKIKEGYKLLCSHQEKEIIIFNHNYLKDLTNMSVEFRTNVFNLDKTISNYKKQPDLSPILNIYQPLNEYLLLIANGISLFNREIEITQSISNNRDINISVRSLGKLYSDKKKSLEELEIKLNQKIGDTEIKNIKNHYTQRKEKKDEELTLYSRLYYASFAVLSGFILFLFFEIMCFHWIIKQNTNLSFSENVLPYLLIASIITLLSFFMTDFRKRMNITRTILDDISQKEVIIDSYAVFMEKKKESSIVIKIPTK